MTHTPENFRPIIESIAKPRGSIVTVFSDFVRIAACVVANQSREDEYFEAIKSYSKEELKGFSKACVHLIDEMESKPFSDLLGLYYQEIASKFTRDNRGEFYTPEEISAVMAKMSFDVESIIEKGSPITVNEPTCGGGGMILQIAKQFSPIETGLDKSHVDLLRVTAQDLSPTVCDMTFINTTLWGIPTRVLLGNTLANTVDKGWHNIHWIRVGEDWRESIMSLESLLGKDPPEDYQEPRLDEVTPLSFDLSKAKQMTFEL